MAGFTGSAAFAEKSKGFQGYAKNAFSKRGTAGKNTYRKDYGSRMDQKSYDALEKNRGLFEKELKRYRSESTASINEAQGRYNAASGQFQSQLSEAQGKVDSAWSTLGKMPSRDSIYSSWFNKEKVPVRVVSGNSVEATYWVPRSMVDELNKQGLNASWVDNGKNYNIEVKQGGRTAGAEMHSLARDLSNTNSLKASFWGNEKVQGSYKGAIRERKKVEGQLNTAQGQVNNYAAQQRSALNKSQSQINAAKQMRDTQIGKATGKREGELAAVRENYEKGRTARMKAYGNLAGMTYNKGGATDE